MQVPKERILGFLFPAETDNWLAILRLGLGLQTTLYSISLRNDWNDLLRGGSGRDFAEALLSVESHFVPRLGWFVALGEHVALREESILTVAWICRVRSFSRTFLSLLRDTGVVFSSMRSREWRVRVIWHG